MNEDLARLVSQLDILKIQLAPLLAKLAAARRSHATNPTPAAEKALDEVQHETEAVHAEYSRLVELLPAASGLPPEVLEELIQGNRGGSAESGRLLRENLTIDDVAPTALIEDNLSDALERIISLLPAGWLDEEPRNLARVEALALPDAYLSLTKGIRRESESHALHRLRQAINVAEDFLENEPFYDQFAGALLASTLTRLATQGSHLGEVGGERDERIAHLWQGPI
jgi:hypothetical protein